jgi:hypothetical protein
MTKASGCVLLYLQRYLEAHPQEKKKLMSLYKKHHGREIEAKDLWRHTRRKIEPSLGKGLVYLIFLSRAGELISSKVPGELFTYRHPEWLRVRS